MNSEAHDLRTLNDNNYFFYTRCLKYKCWVFYLRRSMVWGYKKYNCYFGVFYFYIYWSGDIERETVIYVIFDVKWLEDIKNATVISVVFDTQSSEDILKCNCYFDTTISEYIRWAHTHLKLFSNNQKRMWLWKIVWYIISQIDKK